MALIENPPECTTGDIARFSQVGFQGADAFRAFSLDFVFREIGVQRHIGKQVEGELSIFNQGEDTDGHAVAPGATADDAANLFNRAGDILGAACGRATRDQVAGHTCQAGQILWRGSRASGEIDIQRDDGHVGLLDNDYFQAIVQHVFADGREVEFIRIQWRRRLVLFNDVAVVRLNSRPHLRPRRVPPAAALRHRFPPH